MFEDTFSEINPNNGIVDWFKDGIKDLLESSAGCNDLNTIFNRNDGHPANMASFLFSLKDIAATNGLNRNRIDFNYLLQDDDKFKVVFVLFYTAIIYHVALIVKAKGLEIPRHIAFSGNGSKIISVITTNIALLASYTKVIFEKVLCERCDHPLDVLIGNNPKEATCKGGLLPIAVNDEPQKVTLKNSNGDLISDTDTYAFIESHLGEIEESVKKFFDFMFNEMPRAYDFDNFSISRESLDVARSVCMNDLDTYLERGYQQSLAESGNNNARKVEESLSFYPIKGVIQALSTALYNKYKNE